MKKLVTFAMLPTSVAVCAVISAFAESPCDTAKKGLANYPASQFWLDQVRQYCGPPAVQSSPGDVRRLLGLPVEVVIDGSTTTWRYGDMNHPREVTFKDGRVRSEPGALKTSIESDPVVCLRSNDEMYHTAECPSLRGQGYTSRKLSDVDLTKFTPDPKCNPPRRPSRAVASPTAPT